MPPCNVALSDQPSAFAYYLPGDPLKNLVVASCFAVAVIALSGCAPSLSTSETCVELKAIVSGYKSDNSQEEQKKVMDELKKLAGRSSETLRQEISDVAEVGAERIKDEKDQDREKISQLEERLDKAGDKMNVTCDL